MHALYIQTFSPATENPEMPDRPAWTNPYLAKVTGIYSNSDGHVQGCVLTPEIYPMAQLELPANCKVTPCLNERDLLTSFWMRNSAEPSNVFYTFNGRTFLIPFLYIRSAKYGINPSVPFMMKERYKLGNHCDIADQLSFCGATTKPSLRQMAAFLELPMPTTPEDQIQLLLGQHLATPNLAFLKTIVTSGIEYSHLIHQVAKFWLSRMRPVTI